MQAGKRKNKPQKNGKRDVVLKALKVPAELDEAVNQTILNEVINGLAIKKTIDIKEPEQQARQALKRVQIDYLESGGTARQLIETANLYQLHASKLVGEIDFREVNLFEFFLLRQLTARNNERKEPRIKDIAEDILKGRK